MLGNCQQFASSTAKPLSKFSLIWANVGEAKRESTTIEQRVKIFFIFLGLKCIIRMLFVSSVAVVMLPGIFSFRGGISTDCLSEFFGDTVDCSYDDTNVICTFY